MKLTKIYTRTGDAGETSLIGGKRVPKYSERIEAYGTIDELSAHIGLLTSFISNHNSDSATLPHQLDSINAILEQIQNTLFCVGTYLATDSDHSMTSQGSKPDENDIMLLEQQIDEMNDTLPQLNSFVLPGGNIMASQCHVCRTVCRRAERNILKLYSKILTDDNIDNEPLLKHKEQLLNQNIVKYVNRLSDYLFVLSRKLNFLCNTEEKIWKNSCK